MTFKNYITFESSSDRTDEIIARRELENKKDAAFKEAANWLKSNDISHSEKMKDLKLAIRRLEEVELEAKHPLSIFKRLIKSLQNEITKLQTEKNKYEKQFSNNLK